jgi:hypothetical protein
MHGTYSDLRIFLLGENSSLWHTLRRACTKTYRVEPIVVFFGTTFTLLRKFHQSGIFLVASWYRATYFGYEGGRGIDQKLTYFSVKETYWFHSEWYGEWNFQTRIPYKIPLPDKNSTLYLYVLPNRGARFARQHHIGGTLWIRTMMQQFLYKGCSFPLAHVWSFSQILSRWALYWNLEGNGRIYQQHHGRPTASRVLASPQRWVLCSPLNDEILVQTVLFSFVSRMFPLSKVL